MSPNLAWKPWSDTCDEEIEGGCQPAHNYRHLLTESNIPRSEVGPAGSLGRTKHV